jgi:hypothetical protein
VAVGAARVPAVPAPVPAPALCQYANADGATITVKVITTAVTIVRRLARNAAICVCLRRTARRDEPAARPRRRERPSRVCAGAVMALLSSAVMAGF